MTPISTMLTEQQGDLRDAVANLMAKRSPEAQVVLLVGEHGRHRVHPFRACCRLATWLSK